jgi:hypothetical protein
VDYYGHLYALGVPPQYYLYDTHTRRAHTRREHKRTEVVGEVTSREEGFWMTYKVGFANITWTLNYVCDNAAGVGDLVWTSLANNSTPPYVCL